MARKQELREEDVRKLVQKLCAAHGSVSKFAQVYGFTGQYVGHVLAGRRPPSARLCAVLKLEDDGRRWVRTR